MNIVKINIIELDEMMRLPKDENEYKKSWTHIFTKGFIWNEFILKIKELKQTYKIKIENIEDEQIIFIKKIQNDEYGIAIKTYKYKITISEYLDKLLKFVKNSKNKTLKELYKQNDEFIDIFPPMAFMEYVIRESPKRTYEYIETKEKQKNKIEYKQNKRKPNNNKKEYGLLDCIKIYQKKEGIRKKYEITCESWEVRGYFRHYKNGKTIWVKPFKKGKNKNNNTTNEYKLRSE